MAHCVAQLSKYRFRIVGLLSLERCIESYSEKVIVYRTDFELEHGAFSAILAPILNCTVDCESTDLRSIAFDETAGAVRVASSRES